MSQKVPDFSVFFEHFLSFYYIYVYFILVDQAVSLIPSWHAEDFVNSAMNPLCERYKTSFLSFSKAFARLI